MTPDPAEIRRLHMRLVSHFRTVPEGAPRLVASRILSIMSKANAAFDAGKADLAAAYLWHLPALATAYRRVTQ